MMMWYEKVKRWDRKLITRRLKEIKDLNWLLVSDYVSIFEDGQIGQSIERLFSVPENNDEAPDLSPIFELKTLRKSSGMWTLKHCSTYQSGMTPHELFLEYSYPKKVRTQRSPDRYTTDSVYRRLGVQFGYNDFSNPVRTHTSNGQHAEIGDEMRTDYFSLRPSLTDGVVEIHHRIDGFLSRIDLRDKWTKLQNVVLIICETRGGKGTSSEEFRLLRAYLVKNIKSSSALLKADILSCTFSMSTSEGRYQNREKNRSDKYRIKIPTVDSTRLLKLKQVWESVEQLI
jgi:hypothetical protein